MKVKGFGAWPLRNVSTGGQRPLSDPFNKSFKGDPFNKEYKKEKSPAAEFSSFGLDEYHHYPEQQDLTAEQDDQQKSTEKKRREQQKAKNAKNAKMRRMRMMQQVVCLAAGSVILVSSYQASVARRSEQPPVDPPPIVDPATPDEPTPAHTESYSADWQWNEDNTQVTCIVTDLAGEIVGEIPATITTSEVPAGCSTEGKLTYTATAQYDGQSFTDSRDKILPALGHAFGEGTEVLTDDGEPAIDFECTRCHEHFVIRNSVTEE